MATYTLDQDVLLTIILHAAKWPTCTVNGLLLGSRDGKDSRITACVPLFHTNSFLLAPCVDTALGQVEQLAKQQGLALLGYYHSDARLDAADLHPAGKRTADRVADRQPGACAVVLHNGKLAEFAKSNGGNSPFDLYLREGGAAAAGAPGSGGRGSWKRAPPQGGFELVAAGEGAAQARWQALAARFANLHAAGLHYSLVDFDEHLDDVAKDYRNAGLLGAATALLTK